MAPTKNPKERPAPSTIRDSSLRPHPSRGGTRGYDVAQRTAAVALRVMGEENNPALDHLRQLQLHPSKRTTRRWHQRVNEEGHLHPYEMNGNNPATVLKGHQLLMLSFYRLCYPKATAAEINAFLFATTLPGQQYRFYSESQITEAEDYLGISRKRASTTAYQASLPINLAKRHAFWNYPYPTGIAGTSRSTIIDWDEAGVWVETTNRGYGKCFIGSRAREEGPYNHSQKYTLTAAIRGGPGGGCFVNFALRAGTSVMDTHDFLEDIINGPGGIGVGGGGNTCTFICDNLAAHHSPLIAYLLNSNGHRLVFRAPYNPWDGPIEYFFNYIQQQLSLELHNVTTGQELEQAIYQICQRANGEFDGYFAHCGYAP
ncbi:expressed unknown protein [Seminavis robusta]|uniref:Tc1-like transposase DDE domain-containing protein n=1 Tax=Seminavis robusta TaxID=568900 RepID=A0A9N8EQH1_9STRA|nr:expressed unknown protein [Seminavis robusta]|eukprot:Sro1668_g289870.1 n/a (372) ;mRNA; f:15554-16669